MIPKAISSHDFIYQELPVSKVKKFCNEFYQLLEDFALTVDVSADFVLEVNDSALVYICKRIDQRKDYYLYYHSTPQKLMHMSHEKELGLLAYWVCKYKVIRFINKEDDERFFIENGCTVSDAFAAYIIISAVCNVNNTRAAYFTPKIVLGMFYDFANRDFCKEAVIARIEDLIA